MNEILLVYGGDSVEHEISIITALQISNKYSGKYKLLLCYHKDGEFFINKNLNKVDFYKNNIFKSKDKIEFKANKNFIKKQNKKIFFDAVWIIEHGKNCEDGTLYSFFPIRYRT
jgi:D-alanine-D-alanine ligase